MSPALGQQSAKRPEEKSVALDSSGNHHDSKWKLIGPSTKDGAGFVFSTYYPEDMQVLAFSGDGSTTLKLGSKDGWPEVPEVAIFIFVFPAGASMADARDTALDIAEAQDSKGFKQSSSVKGVPWAVGQFLFNKPEKDGTAREANLMIGSSNKRIFFFETEAKPGSASATQVSRVAAQIAAERRWQDTGRGL